MLVYVGQLLGQGNGHSGVGELHVVLGSVEVHVEFAEECCGGTQYGVVFLLFQGRGHGSVVVAVLVGLVAADVAEGYVYAWQQPQKSRSRFRGLVRPGVLQCVAVFRRQCYGRNQCLGVIAHCREGTL